MNDDDHMMLMLAESLSVMTRKPNTPIILPNADGTYPEGLAPVTNAYGQGAATTTGNVPAGDGVMAAAAGGAEAAAAGSWAGTAETTETNVGGTTAPDYIPPSEELGTPAFTAEMAQAILTGQQPAAPPPTLIPTAETTDAPNYTQIQENDAANYGQMTVADASMPVETQTSPQQNFPQHTEPEPVNNEPDLLVGFDPSKYLAGASASPPPLPPPASHASAKTVENTGETASTAPLDSAYGDIEEGAGTGGQKDSREAMQMLRELSILKGN